MNLISASSSVPTPSRTNDLQARLAKAGIAIRRPSDRFELILAIEKLKRLNAEQREKIATAKIDLQTRAHNAKALAKEMEKKRRHDLKNDIHDATEKLNAANSTLTNIEKILHQIVSILPCPRCESIPSDPKVAIPCGHVICQNCLDKNKETEIKDSQASPSKRPLESLKCAHCALPIISQGLPNAALGKIASTVVRQKIEFQSTRPNLKVLQAIADYADREAGKNIFSHLKLPSPFDEAWHKGIAFEFPLKCRKALIEGFRDALINYLQYEKQTMTLTILEKDQSLCVEFCSPKETIQATPKKGQVIKVDPFDFFVKNYPPQPSES